MMRYDLPPGAPRGAIGLLGGSFDPPHAGHVALTEAALAAFGLARIWWMVSPGNPLKENGPAPMERRLRAARDLVRHPRVVVTDIEARTGTRFTAATLAALRRLYPRQRFVWLMGADNLAQFHRWDDWKGIMESVPLGILARPGSRLSALTSPAARAYPSARIPAAQSLTLARAEAPAWCFVNMPLSPASSTAIRASGDW
ncbi:nicotinate-nucleotide adenylyltransferase [Roseicyclus sp. F158]|uniref:Probable nicotinate-nucleotide adenylyltransferase n=2 Tax=Tropicimonas omnivorans TaxID=3075590 RepID=A0ABU3DDT4_9RHOB|nr:nicotinate-nucleotide adenylyltransferase [Roseicyclus sp. F158]MDT0681881.1 nicotinate-nucleotide adenylyltransferase [Roseicyclus sp. F158]